MLERPLPLAAAASVCVFHRAAWQRVAAVAAAVPQGLGLLARLRQLPDRKTVILLEFSACVESDGDERARKRLQSERR